MTLEDYLANEDIARSVQDELNALVDDDFSIAFTAEGNTAIFAYTSAIRTTFPTNRCALRRRRSWRLA